MPQALPSVFLLGHQVRIGTLVFAQQLRKVRWLNGSAEIVALKFIAGALLEELRLLLRLDAFGADRQTQRAPHRNDRVCDPDVLGAAGNVANERAVNLDGVDGKFLEIGKGRVTGAKSSIASLTPICFSEFNVRMAFSTLCISMLSVISSSRMAGSISVSSRMSATSCIRFSSLNWRADKLTAIVTAGRPSRCHAMFCRQAALSTQRPIGTISPVSSAIAMKRVGPTSPSSGWRHL